ncbi:MAG: hypothetical protein OXF02_04660 [Simkaniaceae bacterium]|nr:hypothetical protein [Simkaniaceae bacterium]
MSCICCCPSRREPVIRAGVVEESPPPVTVQPEGPAGTLPKVRLYNLLWRRRGACK